MRTLFMSVVLAAACGGGGSGAADPQQCSADASSFHAIVDPRQSCTVDSDCTAILDNCFGPAFCATYVNVANADAARAIVADGRNVCQCVDCMAPPPPACVNGVCGARRAP